MIVRNAEPTLDRALKSIRPHVDEIVVIDTGSSDRTVDIARATADVVEVFLGPNGDWGPPAPHIDHFGLARNRSFERAHGDWFVWMDADDEWVGGEHLRDLAASGEADAYFIHYTYAIDDQGRTHCELARERLIARSVYVGWGPRIHEVCALREGARIKEVERSFIDLVHRPDPGRTASVGRNLALLRKQLEDEQGNPSPRTLYYLGREMRSTDPKQAVEYFEQCARHPYGNLEERYQAAHMAADIHRASGNYHDAERLDGYALAILPGWPDAYFGLAEVAYHRQQWERCVDFSEGGFARKTPHTTAILNPMDYVWTPHLYYNVALYHLGRASEALQSVETALAVAEVPILHYNRGWYRRQEEIGAVRARTAALIDDYRRFDEWDKLRSFLDVVPHVVEEAPEVEEARRAVARQMKLLTDPAEYLKVYGEGAVIPWTGGSYDNVPTLLPRVGWAEKVFTDIGAKVLLDAGSHDGFGAIYLAKKGFTVHCVEMNPKAVESGRASAEKEGVGDRVIWHVGAVEDIPNFHLEVDGVYCFETLEHVMDPAETLPALEAALKPGGTLLICVPHGEWEPNPKPLMESVPGHLRAFTVRTLGALLQGRHQVEITVNPSGNPYLPHQAHLWARCIPRPFVDVLIPTRPGFEDERIAWCTKMRANFGNQAQILVDDGPGTFAEKINRMIKATTAPYVLLWNDDAAPGLNLISTMLRHFTKHPKLGVLGMYSNCDLHWHHEDPPAGIGITPSLEEVQAKWTDLLKVGQDRRGRPLQTVQWLAFYGVMIPRAVIDQVGLLDEELLNYADDADFCHRAARLGFEIGYANDGMILHFGGTSLNAQPSKERKLQVRESKRRVAYKSALPSVDIVCPLDWEPWSPARLQREGLGGSETAAVIMARELALEGHAVRVFNQLDSPARGYAGVQYLPWRDYPKAKPADVIVSWRAPETMDLGEIGRQRYLWMHDWNVGDRLTPVLAERFTAIWALSKAHQAHLLERYPFLSEDQVWVTQNGIDLSRFNDPGLQVRERDPYKLVYSSSPDRGLDILLTIFPKIKVEFPQASLDVYYGWSGYDRMAASYPQMQAFKAKVLELLEQPGVTHHGAVSQRDLARAFLGAGLWVYPTYFTETSCITAMEVQAAGVIPVTRPLAALQETVGPYGILVEGDVHDPDVQGRYVEEVATLLRSPGTLDARRAFLTGWAAGFAWSGVRRQWVDWFTS